MPIENLSPNEMKAFLQEAEEQIQLLDEDIIRLEKEASNPALLNEIFRAAHTLKGSSGMIGFDAMTGLTHCMEDLLDRLRNGALRVSPELVDALLLALDGLRQLLREFNGGAAVSMSIDEVVKALQSFDGTAAEELEDELVSAMEVSEAAPQERETAPLVLNGDVPAYRVTLGLSPECGWAAVRMLQAHKDLAAMGEIVRSLPSLEDIEAEHVNRTLEIIVTTKVSREDIRTRLSTIGDLQTVQVEETAGHEAPGPLEASAPAVAPAAQASASEVKADAAKADSAKSEAAQSVRIDTTTLDSLMNMVGELVTGRTQLAQISRALSARYRDDELVEHLAATVPHFGRIVDELNERMMQARMLPIGLLFSKFPRMVRDLARSLGKEVDFVIQGADTEIDRSVIDRVRDPIVHMLRNAVDHGIESPEVRTQAGKNALATLRLVAHHEQGHIFISVSEDGKGIDANAVRAAAVKKGLVTQEAADRLTDEEAAELIFLPGFSTAEKTTEVSGRGVGMDVVHRSITDLGGSVIIETQPGLGTTFTLRLPLTLTTFGALLVSAGGSSFAIPLSSVQETIKLDEGAIHHVFGREVLSLRGAIMPLIRLHREGLAIPGVEEGTEHGFVVVLKVADKSVALGVDGLMEQQEVVVKPLEGYASAARGLSGATILGDGSVALILDVQGMMRSSVLGGPVESERIAA